MAKSPPKPVEIYETPIKMVDDEFHINSCRNFIPSTEWKESFRENHETSSNRKIGWIENSAV